MNRGVPSGQHRHVVVGHHRHDVERRGQKPSWWRLKIGLWATNPASFFVRFAGLRKGGLNVQGSQENWLDPEQENKDEDRRPS